MDNSVECLPAVLVRASNQTNAVRFVARNKDVLNLSYREILRRVCLVADNLKILGIQPGNRVAIILKTSPEFYDAFWGILWVGAIPVTIAPPNFAIQSEYAKRTANMLKKVDVSLVLTTKHLLNRIAYIVQDAFPETGCKSIEDMLDHSEPLPGYYPVDGDEIALIQFSSGTEAEPKPIALTHRQILANVQAIIDLITSHNPGKPIGACWLPLYHDMGLIGCLVTATVLSCDMIYLAPETFVSNPASWLQIISKYRVTVSPAPNFAYGMCADNIDDTDINGLDLSCWRLALNGGEFIAESTLNRFISRFQPVGFNPNAMIPVYGLAEAALAVTGSKIMNRFHVERFSSESLFSGKVKHSDCGVPLICLGAPLASFELRITNNNNEQLPEGVIGKLLVKGPSIMKGYFRDEAATNSVISDGWLDTGDDGFLLNGKLFLYGRRKDHIVINGRNHSSQIVEDAAEAVLNRRNISAAVGIGPEQGQIETMSVFIERERHISLKDDQNVAERVYKSICDITGLLPEKIILVPAKTLPRTTSGKIQRKEIIRQFHSGTIASTDRIFDFKPQND